MRDIERSPRGSLISWNASKGSVMDYGIMKGLEVEFHGLEITFHSLLNYICSAGAESRETGA